MDVVQFKFKLSLSTLACATDGLVYKVNLNGQFGALLKRQNFTLGLIPGAPLQINKRETFNRSS